MRIDCDRCPSRRGAEPCDDCLVTFVLQLEGDEDVPEEGERLDAPQARAVRALSDAGLVEDVRVVRLEDTG